MRRGELWRERSGAVPWAGRMAGDAAPGTTYSTRLWEGPGKGLLCFVPCRGRFFPSLPSARTRRMRMRMLMRTWRRVQFRRARSTRTFPVPPLRCTRAWFASAFDGGDQAISLPHLPRVLGVLGQDAPTCPVQREVNADRLCCSCGPNPIRNPNQVPEP